MDLLIQLVFLATALVVLTRAAKRMADPRLGILAALLALSCVVTAVVISGDRPGPLRMSQGILFVAACAAAFLLVEGSRTGRFLVAAGIGGLAMLPEIRKLNPDLISGRAHEGWTALGPATGMLVLLAVILLARAARGQSQLKADLRRESECLERLVNTSSEGIFIADREGRAVLWNPALELMSGIDSGRANGRPVAELLSVIDWKNGERPIEGALDGIEVVSTGSTRPAPGEEGGKEFGIYCSPLPGREGEVAAVLGIIRPSREIRATQSGRDDRGQTAAFSDLGDKTPSVSSVPSPEIPADPLELPVDAT